MHDGVHGLLEIPLVVLGNGQVQPLQVLISHKAHVVDAGLKEEGVALLLERPVDPGGPGLRYKSQDKEHRKVCDDHADLQHIPFISTHPEPDGEIAAQNHPEKMDSYQSVGSPSQPLP